MTAFVGVRDFKNQLSECLRRSKAGERIVVTERGVPVAELVSVSEETKRIHRGIAEGWLKPPKSSGRREPLNLPPIPPGPSVDELLAEERRD